MRGRTVQRLMCMALLVGCLDVCLGQPAEKYQYYYPWSIFWACVNVVAGLLFLTAEIRERSTK